jgi:hypothetical protein
MKTNKTEDQKRQIALIKSKFHSPPAMPKELRANYRNIEALYSEIFETILEVNADTLQALPKESIQDIYSAISRLLESLFWVRKAMTAKPDKDYETTEWLVLNLIEVEKQESSVLLLAKRYSNATNNLVKLCPLNLFLENALMRLLNSYNISKDVTQISQSIRDGRKRRSSSLGKGEK